MKLTLMQVREKFLSLPEADLYRLANPENLETWLNQFGWTTGKMTDELSTLRGVADEKSNAEYAQLVAEHEAYESAEANRKAAVFAEYNATVARNKAK